MASTNSDIAAGPAVWFLLSDNNPTNAPEVSVKRFALLDDLRGIAATFVVVAHLAWLLPAPFNWVEKSPVGVEAFFVLSGFVIAYTLRGLHISPGFIGLFFVRRSIRLDAVYWAVLVAEIFILLVVWGEPIPGWRNLISNFTYTQELAGHQSILFVAWTLCLELQFYLFFAVVLGFTRWMDSRSNFWVTWRLTTVLWVSLTALSVLGYALANQGQRLPGLLGTNGLFINHWFMFFAGVLACWVFLGSVADRTLWTFVGLVLLGLVALGAAAIRPANDVSAVSALAILVMFHLFGKTPVMHAGFGSRVLSYLGRISYSLYLCHATVGVNFIYIVSERFGTGIPLMLVTALAAFALSVGSAHILYEVVEAPSIRLSKQLPAILAARNEPTIERSLVETGSHNR